MFNWIWCQLVQLLWALLRFYSLNELMKVATIIGFELISLHKLFSEIFSHLKRYFIRKLVLCEKMHFREIFIAAENVYWIARFWNFPHETTEVYFIHRNKNAIKIPLQFIYIFPCDATFPSLFLWEMKLVWKLLF